LDVLEAFASETPGVSEHRTAAKLGETRATQGR